MMPHQGIYLCTSCTFISLAFSYLSEQIPLQLIENRRLIIVDTNRFSCFYELNTFLQPHLQKNHFTDYLFLTDINPRWRQFLLPGEIKMDASLSSCESKIKQRLRHRTNAPLVMVHLAREKKKRSLTCAEKHVAHYLSQGISFNEMSQRRGVTVKTIYGQVKSIRKKLGNITNDVLANYC